MEEILKELEQHVKDMSAVAKIPDNWLWWDQKYGAFLFLKKVDDRLISSLKKLLKIKTDGRIRDTLDHAIEIRDMLIGMEDSKPSLDEQSRQKKSLVEFYGEIFILVRDLKESPLYNLPLSEDMQQFMRERTIEDFCNAPMEFLDELNGLILAGQPGKSDANESVPMISGQKWLPPKNKERLLKFAFNRTISLLRKGSFVLAIGTLYSALVFINVYRDKDARTARFAAFFFMLKFRPKVNIPLQHFKSLFMSVEETRMLDEQVLDAAFKAQLGKYKVRFIPQVYRKDGSSQPSVSNCLLSLAYVLVTKTAPEQIYEEKLGRNASRIYQLCDGLTEELVGGILQSDKFNTVFYRSPIS